MRGDSESGTVSPESAGEATTARWPTSSHNGARIRFMAGSDSRQTSRVRGDLHPSRPNRRSGDCPGDDSTVTRLGKATISIPDRIRHLHRETKPMKSELQGFIAGHSFEFLLTDSCPARVYDPSSACFPCRQPNQSLSGLGVSLANLAGEDILHFGDMPVGRMRPTHPLLNQSGMWAQFAGSPAWSGSG